MKKLISLCKNTKFNALDKKLQNFPLFKFIILILNMSELENINQTENINEVITDTSIENANVKETKNNIKSNKSEISNGKKRIKLNRLATKGQLQARLARNALVLCGDYQHGRSLHPLKPTNE